MLHFMENLCLHYVDILEKFKKDCALNQKYIVEKDDFQILIWLFMPFNEVWGHTLCCEKILGVPQSQSFSCEI